MAPPEPDDGPPGLHLASRLSYNHAVDEVTIREASTADAAALAAVERNSPLVLGDSMLAIDRGADYFAAARLMGQTTVIVAEVAGRVVGAFCGVAHPVMLGGERRMMLYIHHARILPVFQDRGIGKKLGTAFAEKYRGIADSHYWYISRANAHSQAFARRAQNRWTFGPTLIGIETAAFTGPHAGRPATPADAPAIVAMLNAAHAGEEMFLPYTEVSLAERLDRDPEQYGWSNVWLTGRAVVGVWPEGDSITVRRTDREGIVSESRGAAVLDFGYLPGGEDDLVAVLGAWCAWLTVRGMTELSIFSSPGCRHWPLLKDLGTPTPFDFWTASIPQPVEAATRGLHVDHVYF